MSKTHIIIPARYKSTRLPAKPLLEIHGKPMILWTAEKAARATFADSVCVATDDARIAQVCEQAGVRTVMTDEQPSGTDRLAQAADILALADDDIVVNMQGDEPLVPPELLLQVRDLLVANPDCAMATLCEAIDNTEDFHKTSVVKVVKAGQQALYFSRAPIPHDRDNQSTPNQYAYRHLGLYAYRVRALKAFSAWQQGTLEQLESLEQLRMLENGERIAIDVASTTLPLGVDTPEDLARLNAMPLDEWLSF
ncbi:3-deoxy-D-manno-octulosonate cytidylyltransferase [Moraxella caviae]|uniref:3-deoxy-manno-octulosonate cytidylyltransferase n=1 Tax=Moraxella caviae TaxID=34060 RepID=A0A1T0A649_9GAMM|nr:3-deoxy-manno-octulosonate cytidylyltransferase [Moraxella caviae]OOR91059.1 3-deoxy-D-manno-octulosonate cytidylyltransferase [Moraxella caviae]STZ14249.1 3-deoxy-manno-octulosonate cytidylyltransferase [Moraxella caviae]VEW13126.1 3-deoxy-manno-octulosonate cytidylyltransferase [Moraxella caviae]